MTGQTTDLEIILDETDADVISEYIQSTLPGTNRALISVDLARAAESHFGRAIILANKMIERASQ